jgi:hypothetical protein
MLTGFRRGGKPASGRARKASPPGRSPKGQRDGASRHLPGFQDEEQEAQEAGGEGRELVGE